MPAMAIAGLAEVPDQVEVRTVANDADLDAMRSIEAEVFGAAGSLRAVHQVGLLTDERS